MLNSRPYYQLPISAHTEQINTLVIILAPAYHGAVIPMLILDFDNVHRFCIVASILCLKQILDCVHIVPTVIGYVNILLKSIVSRKSKRTGYQICFILLYICIFI